MLPLARITETRYDLRIDLAYATPDNFTGRPVYRPEAGCFLHRDAAPPLARAIELARPLGYRLLVLDAFRPVEAQWALWTHTPDPEFLAHPRRGSLHSRGVAVDVTLTEAESGEILDMGTPFDAFTRQSYHATLDISAEAQRNRHLLLGIMVSAGWEFFLHEWWHYQLPGAASLYPLLSDSILGADRLMA